MAIDFTNKPDKWENEGTAPPEDLKANGFQAGYKPPASIFNHQWHNTGECIEELQTKVSEENTARTTHESNKNNPHSVTKSQMGLGNVDNTSDLNKPISTATQTALDNKVDKVSGKSLINEDVSDYIQYDSETHTITFDTKINYYPTSPTLHIPVDGNDFPQGIWLRKDGTATFGSGDINQTDINYSGITVQTIDNSADVVAKGYDSNMNEVVHKLSEKANKSDVDALPVKKNVPNESIEINNNTYYSIKEEYIFGDTRPPVFKDDTETALSQGNIVTFQTIKYDNPSTHDAFTLGSRNILTGYAKMAIGYGNVMHSANRSSMAIGVGNTSKTGAMLIGGYNSTRSEDVGTLNRAFALGEDNDVQTSGFALGFQNIAHMYNTVIGRRSKYPTRGSATGMTGDVFVIGNGALEGYASVSPTRSNAFRVTYEGKAYGLSSYGSSGADYAEYFEWLDVNPDNEDRRGRIVTLEGDKIRFATADDDYILGVVSATPCVVGDVHSEDWQGKWLTDAFGEKLTQTVHIPAKYDEIEKIDPETGETTTEKILISKEHDTIQWILNPDFDSSKDEEYVNRENRKEWSPIGLMGKLVVIDDGTCEVNGYCKAGVNGIATKADDGYRVMARIDDTHIRVLVR